MTLMSLAAAPNVKNTAAALPFSKDHAAALAGDAFDDQRRRMSIHPAQECSMCGDVGFSSELFRCSKCLHRFQHTYCSRYYPSMPSKDVCDWCSQETNPSAGSTSSSMNTSGMRARPAKPTNLGKRKVTAGADQTTSPLSTSPRKSVDLKSRKDLVMSSSTSSCVNHKDALELLLDVAQRVAEGQVSLDQQQQQEVEILNSHELSIRRAKIQQLQVEILGSHEHSARRAKTEQQQVKILSNYEARRGKTQQQLQVEVLSNHEARRAKIQQQLQVEVLSSHDLLNGSTSYNRRAKNVEVLARSLDESRRIKTLQSPNFKRQRCENQQQLKACGRDHQQQLQMRSGKDHQSQQKLLTNSRSMGRRYKLLSDVLCQKLAATNPTC